MSELDVRKTLSILIPARNEEFLSLTIEDILKNKRGETNIIVGCDGNWPEPRVADHPDVILVHYSKSIGQRAMTNQLCRLSNAKYVMKIDAHCAFDEGFDVKMMEKMQDDVTMVPVMRNLHVFDWACPQGHRRYQGPSGVCTVCGEPTKKEIVWVAKTNPQSTAYRFDRSMHFQYWKEWGKKQEGDLTESMSIQGSCFMLTREKYWELDICSEDFNSWGQQGVEVACKTWLSGGRVLVNRTTWYAHMFRTQGGDFSFPYENPEKDIQKNRDLSKELFAGDKWDKAIHPFKWLIDKFNPPDWKQTVGVLYYTDNELDESLMKKCQTRLLESIGDKKLVSVSLRPLDFGDNITIPLERGQLTLFKQILAGLEKLDTDIVFFAEHDVLYNKSHFDFIPEDRQVYYYNKNIWRVRTTDGYAVAYDHKSAHALCAYRETLIKEYKERVRKIEAGGWHQNGYEPGTRSIRRGGFSDSTSAFYESKDPIIDIRHGGNLSASKWAPEEFRSLRSCRNWKVAPEGVVPFWGKWGEY